MTRLTSILSLFILLTLFSKKAHAQTLESGDLFARITTTINNLPSAGTNVFTLPTASQNTDWELLLADFFVGNWSTAATNANAIGYDLIEFNDTGNGDTYYILETQGTNHWGSYFLNPDACRQELVLMSPHAKNDFNTAKQGGYIFKEIEAWCFMLSGTHRCNSAAHSDCDGTTSTCGSSEQFRISDLAHEDESIWQTTTDYIFTHYSNTYFAQFHGFTKQSTDPYVIMSNGTRDTPSPDYLVALSNELVALDPVLTFKIGHIDLTWSRLLGFTNTNGRLINSTPDPCMDGATVTSGRFMHIEQEKSRLRQDQTGWNKMGQALANTFVGSNCAPVALPLELLRFEGQVVNQKAQLAWSVGEAIAFSHFEVEWSSDNERFEAIGRVDYEGGEQFSFVHEELAMSNYYRLKLVDLDGEYAYSKVIHLANRSNDEVRIQQRANGLTFSFEDAVQREIRIYNQLGHLVDVQNESRISYDFDTANLLAGFYIYTIDTGKHRSSGKLIVR